LLHNKLQKYWFKKNDVFDCFLVLKYKFQMKKIIGLLLITTLFNACDDGDVQVETVDLNDAQTKKCTENNVLYQIKDTKSIILELSSAQFTSFFENKMKVKTDFIAGSLLYRIYNGNVALENICGSIRPTTPNVTEEWTAQSALLQVTTTAVKSPPVESGFSKIIGYKHAMILKNVSWQKSNGTSQVETERPFGNYTINAVNLPINFTATDLKTTTCNNNSLFIVNGSESFLLKLDATTFTFLFPAIPVIGTKQASISSDNKLTYTLFNGVISNDYFCTTPLPATPIIVEQWISDSTASNGIIKVKTELYGTTQHKYIVTLETTTLKRGTNDLYLGTSYKLGEFISSN
jgi:hypothetical protein